MMGIDDAVKERLMRLMYEKKLSMYKLSLLSAVPQSTIKSILYGGSSNPGIVTLKKLCDGMDITITEFFDTKEFRELEQEIQ